MTIAPELSDLRPKTSPALRTLQIGAEGFGERGGGLNRYFRDLLRYLPAAGVHSRGLVVGSCAGIEDASVQAVSSLDASLLKRIFAIRKSAAGLLIEQSVDCVVGHFAPYTWPTLSLVQPDRPLVFHFHGPWAEESRCEGSGRASVALKRWIEQKVYAAASRVIVLSSAFAKVLEEQYRVPAERIRVVSGGVDCDRFDIPLTRDQCREQLSWPTDRPIVVVVRRLVRRMGLEHLIDAVSILRSKMPDLLVCIAGKGLLGEELKERIQQHSLQRQVRLIGFVPDDDLPKVYRAADLTAVPSVALEGFGLIAAESLAAGTAVLVTPVGGLPSVVERLTRNLILPDTTTQAWADALQNALTGKLSLPSPMACQQFAKQNFDWPNIASQIRDVYVEAGR